MHRRIGMFGMLLLAAAHASATFAQSTPVLGYVAAKNANPKRLEVFKQGLKSYRELPLRLAEFGSCHRNEPSGALHGIMRVRAFTQDDAHIFCAESQVQEEAVKFIELLQKVYTDFGFQEVLVKLSTRPDKRVGSEEQWDKNAEAAARGLWQAHDESYRQRRRRGVNPNTPARIVEDDNDD